MVERATNKRVPNREEMLRNVREDKRWLSNEFYENNQWRHDNVDRYDLTLLMTYIIDSSPVELWIVEYLLDNTAFDINH